MTTQHTHSEHSDVEESVVTYSSVSDAEAGAETSSPPPVLEAAAPTQTHEAAADETTGEKEEPSSTGLHEDPKDSQESFTTKETQEARGNGAETADVPSFSFNAGPGSANAPASEEGVRPFTDFIAEFQQAATRFSSPQQSDPTDTPAAAEPAQIQNDETQTAAPAENNEPKAETTAPVERPVSPLLRPATPRQRAARHSGNRHREETPVEKSEQALATPTPAEATPVVTEPAPSQSDQPEEQPRPARRYRFDRPAAPVTNGPAASVPTATPPVQPRLEDNKDVAGRSSSALSVRPENGYASNEQNGEKEVQLLQQTKQAATVAQTAETPAAKQPDVQEAPMAGNSTEAPAPVAPDNERRRRHGQERQRAKAQPTPAKPATTPPAIPVVPTAEIVVAVPEPEDLAKEEVHAEDLPPLEYSELQKASTRRRRRRHSSGSTNTIAATNATDATSLPTVVKAVTPEVPAVPAPIPTPARTPTAVPSIAVPRTPAPVQPAAAANPYTITSGYTVNQMNQSREGSNAFMGPDPSPARGSIAAQNVRTIRTDVQRTPSYPVRTTEATSASVQQLANVVSQAIQTQTDRMVAELRRANQSPTNVSVTMPPFPSTERVGVFVDVANLLYSARTLRMTVDFGKLLDFLRGNRRLIRAQAYCPTSPQAGDEQMFLQAVKGLGYRITTKNYKTFSSGAKKADLDLDLCMDVVRLVDGGAVDCIVLVSGDSDFMPMLDYCSDHGVRVEVAAFDEAMSATLRQSCDLFINLSMLEEIRA